MEQILYLLSRYRYFVLFPLAVAEGPILAVIAGFLCIGNFLNPFIVYPIIIAGDITGDSIFYGFGRWGLPPFLKKIVKLLGFSTEKKDRVLTYFNENPNRTVALSKIALGIGFAGIYIAGNAKIPYQRFIRICFITSVLQYVIYFSIGLLFGKAYEQIDHYLNFFAAFVSVTVIAIGIFYLVKSIRKKL